jgi:hypothetical protein
MRDAAVGGSKAGVTVVSTAFAYRAPEKESSSRVESM